MQRIEPGPTQESAWDYPRPPRLERAKRRVRVMSDGVQIADSSKAYRVCETASPPTYYVPREDVDMSLLKTRDSTTFCEWKGRASYLDLRVNDHVVWEAAWYYPEPSPGYIEIRDHLAFYPGRVECYLDDERVRPQAGVFYGGWITDDIVGPFKGDPGTQGW